MDENGIVEGAGEGPGAGEPEGEDRGEERQRPSRARWTLVGVLAVLFGAMLLYQMLHAGKLEQTALFYVGMPAFIGLAIALWARPKSVTGTALACTAVGLTLAGAMLGEGVICLVMAAPLFFLFAAVIGALADKLRRYDDRFHAFAAVPLIAVLGLALEGSGVYELPRDNTASVTRTVSATPDELARALAAPPRFADPEPVFLRQIPFPKPQRATGAGLETGDQRLITFNPRKTLGIGATTTPRSMRLVITESEPGRVVFDVRQDSTLARWLNLRTAEVRWRSTAGGRATEMTWTLDYQRTFDPGWYFGPIQQYGMTQAAAYLADTFTPEGAGERR
ncbi:hypothetical protein [Streptomyces gobiensis]|uniref:hypothetical protein n=1 Tax=Streptomyces gobiensis TaxID=2875706 RepID=UPI001E3D55B0|nr:hypothetical protein [Streptomyces gobiensis]UGY91531.1 hypothetical protein test1122_07200 [Streptomyces gobiensis]